MFLLFLPLLAAACYGLGYVFLERASSSVSLSTFLLLSIPFEILVILMMHITKAGEVNFSFLNGLFQNSSLLWTIILAVILPTIGWVFTIYAVQNVSATYTAFAEISYPLFTVVFLAGFFGVKQFNAPILLGGLLILIGSALLVYGQLRLGSSS